MRELPILMNGAMVRATLDGSKTQTRRIVKLSGGRETDVGELKRLAAARDPLLLAMCPCGARGDRLWVRESFHHEQAEYLPELSGTVPLIPASTVYRADMSAETLAFEKRVGVPRDMRWTPSIHMPRKLSRILLEVTRVRVEHLQDISEADAIAEGLPDSINPIGAYAELWDSLKPAAGFMWADNPWVWVVEFKRIEVTQ